MNSQNYDITVRWHTPADATIRGAIIKVYASSPELAERIARRVAWETLPADAIIDYPEPDQAVPREEIGT